MKKTIVLTGLLALAGAQGVRADDTKKASDEAAQEVREAEQDAAKKTSEAQQDAAKQTSEARQDAAKETRDAQQEVKETQQQASEEVREAQRDESSQDRSASAQGTEKKHAFEGKENFDVDGKVQKVSKGSITIAREELPAMTLHLEQYTAIELDGEKAARTQLKPGQDVQASFNLNGAKPVALELKAKKSQ
jgi:vacuolar-type H+-ATPase subunit H